MNVFLKIVPFSPYFIIGKSRHYSNKNNTDLINILKTMPKEPKHIAEAQKQRRKIKEKFSRYVPGKVTLQVLGTGAKGAPRALYLFSDQSRYLFNCGEGTQRLAHEHKMKLAKLEHIFVTQPTWRNMGGLPGTALTIQDVGVPEITLHGPPGLGEIFVATKRFVVIRDLKIKMADCSEGNMFEDNVLKVEYVHLKKSDVISNSPQEPDTNTYRDSEVEVTVQQEDASTSTRSEKNRRRRKRSSSRSSSGGEVEDNTDYYAHERKRLSKSKRRRSRSLSIESGSRTVPEIVSPTSEATLRANKLSAVSTAFVCRLRPRPGPLDLARCVGRGVPPGPLLGRLKAGEDVRLADGVVVRSAEVREADDPGPVFVVLECPSLDYLDSLVNSAALKKVQSCAQKDEDLASLVVHFTPKEVSDDARYRQWIDKFSPSTRHIMLNESNCCMGSEAVHRIQYKLNLLSDSIFPLLKDNGTNVIDEVSDTPCNKKQKCEDKSEASCTNSSLQNDLNFENLTVQSRPASPEPFIHPKTICTYQLRPKRGLDKSIEIKINPKEYINETMAVENFPAVLNELKDKLHDERKKLHNSEYPKILFLGTGSCIPNKTRNTSGILLTTKERRHIVLDCGEGTCGQLVRFFGPDASDSVLADIDAVYISHLHADHHIGLIGLLQGRRRAIERTRARKRPVYLLAPKQIMAWLSFYDKCFEDVVEDFVLVPNGDLVYNNPSYPTDMNSILSELNLSDIKTCLVRHCPNAFGVSLVDKNGLKLTYSGDTMPADSLIELGKDSDVLIHEATMEDELAQEAIIKMHSTTSQAIEVGEKMSAKHVILTHFSQRYAKLPRYNENFSGNVGIAFDNMQVDMNDIVLVPQLLPALKLMFAEHYEDVENKAMKRSLRLEREKSALADKNLKRKQSLT